MEVGIMKQGTSVWLFDWRRRWVMGPVELAFLALITGLIGASALDFGLAMRHTDRLERAVDAGLAAIATEGDVTGLDLTGAREAALAYLGLNDQALPKGTVISARETCSCQQGIAETMESACPVPCEGAEAIERRYVRVTFTQDHDWILADGLMGRKPSLTVSRTLRIR